MGVHGEGVWGFMEKVCGGFMEKVCGGLVWFVWEDCIMGYAGEFNSLLFCSVSWTVIFGLTREFIWKELKSIGIKDLNNLWR